MAGRGGKFGIREGDVFRVGPHVVGCGDLVRKGQWEKVIGSRSYEWVYSDPPWGESTAKMFRTMNKQKGVDVRYKELMDRYAEVMLGAKIGGFGEMGVEHPHDIPNRLDPRGMRMISEQTVLYSGGSNIVQMFSKNGFAVPRIAGLKGQKVVNGCFAVMERGQTVVDPFLGFGGTVKAAERHGLRCVGMELNPDRLLKCLEWGESKGMEVVRV